MNAGTFPGIVRKPVPNRWVVTSAHTTMVAGTSYLATATVVDAFHGNVRSLLAFDGTNGSTTFTDATGRTWTPSGNAQISTAQSQFGGASAVFDGAGDFISTPYVANDFDWWNTPFTAEFWVRPTNLANWSEAIVPNQLPIAMSNGDNINSTFWSFGPDVNGALCFYYFNGAAQFVVSANGVIPVNSWTHIAVTQAGGTIRLFANGTQVATATVIDTPQSNSSLSLLIGGGRALSITGNIDDFRITRGVARYTSNFTPPTSANSAATTPEFSVPTGITAGDFFAVSSISGAARVLPGAGRQIGTAGVGTAVSLTAGQTLRIVARNATQLDIV